MCCACIAAYILLSLQPRRNFNGISHEGVKDWRKHYSQDRHVKNGEEGWHFWNEQPDSLVPGFLSLGSIMVGLGVGEGIVA